LSDKAWPEFMTTLNLQAKQDFLERDAVTRDQAP
jgi:hypothetical protein